MHVRNAPHAADAAADNRSRDDAAEARKGAELLRKSNFRGAIDIRAAQCARERRAAIEEAEAQSGWAAPLVRIRRITLVTGVRRVRTGSSSAQGSRVFLHDHLPVGAYRLAVIGTCKRRAHVAPGELLNSAEEGRSVSLAAHRP